MNTLLSKAAQDEEDEDGDIQAVKLRAHEAFWQSLRVRKPDVVLVLHCAAG